MFGVKVQVLVQTCTDFITIIPFQRGDRLFKNSKEMSIYLFLYQDKKGWQERMG